MSSSWSTNLPDSKSVVKFLIIRFSSIGDIVLTTPIVRCLKNQVEDCEIHYLTKKAFHSVLQANPYIDRIHLFDHHLKVVIKTLKAESFDYIIDLHHNFRTERVKLALKRMSFSFNKLNVEKWLMVNLKINRLPNIHIVDRYFKTVQLFDITNDLQGIDFFIDPANEIDLKEFPEEFRNGFIAMAIGAKHVTKQLPDEKTITLIKKLNYPVILLGGKEDALRGEKIAKIIGYNCLNACGKYSIQQSASIVKQSKLVITPDTGLMHIASAFKKTIFSIWGNTIPELGMFPYLPGENSKIYETKGLKCRPCSKIGFEKCPKKHFNCMNQIKLDEVATDAKQLVNP
jgi:ADP-heptose:LPS heptosyltransferase